MAGYFFHSDPHHSLKKIIDFLFLFFFFSFFYYKVFFVFLFFLLSSVGGAILLCGSIVGSNPGLCGLRTSLLALSAEEDRLARKAHLVKLLLFFERGTTARANALWSAILLVGVGLESTQIEGLDHVTGEALPELGAIRAAVRIFRIRHQSRTPGTDTPTDLAFLSLEVDLLRVGARSILLLLLQ
jgi:hypothetical protein